MKLIILCLVSFGLAAQAAVQERELGPVTAVKRTFTVDLNKVLANLVQDEKTKSWSATVDELNKSEIVLNAKDAEIVQGTSANIDVLFGVRPQGYKVTLYTTKTLTQKEASDAIVDVYQKAELNKVTVSEILERVNAH
jgi:hypothetical protein